MHDTDELAETLRSYWIFMAGFVLILCGVVGYVNLIGTLEKVNEPVTRVIAAEDTVTLPDRQRLHIKADILGQGVVPLTGGETAVSAKGSPYFEFYGEGNVVFSYSNDKQVFTYERKFSRFPGIRRGVGDASQYGNLCVTVPADVDIPRIRYEGDGGRLYKDLDKDMRDLTRMYKQYLWELYPDVNENYEGFWRLVYVSHVFVELRDKNDPTRTVASAAIRITSNDDWALGIKYCGTPKVALAQLGVADAPEASEGTLLEIVSYWQAED